MAEPARERDFLRALLGARLFVLLPMSDDSGNLHFLMFTRPDGLTVVPVFTSLPLARASAGNGARVAELRGRELFEATRGATVMLDPNEVGMTLYPEEVAALLDEGVATVAPIAFDGPGVELFPAHLRYAWLMDVLERALAPVESVDRFHLAAARPKGGTGDPDRLLVIVAVPDAFAERTARAIAVALEGMRQTPDLPIDLSTYSADPQRASGVPDGLEHTWTRSLRTNAADGTDG